MRRPQVKKGMLRTAIALVLSVALLPGQDLGGNLSIVDAGQLAIGQNPQLSIQREQIQVNRGLLLGQQSAFDLKLNAGTTQSRTYQALLPGTQQSYGVDAIATNSTQTSLGATQQFRNGVSVTPSVRLDHTSDNLSQTAGLNQPVVSVQVVLPLLRNRGRAAVAAGEAAAEMEVDSSILDLNHMASQLLANTASAYWNYLGAVKSLEVYRESEKRGEQFLRNVEALATADAVPRIQIQDAIASLAGRRASRIGAEQSVIRAQQEFAVLIGTTPEQVMQIGMPSDAFPEVGDVPPVSLDAAALRQWINTALGNRGDYLSTKLRADQQRVLLAGTRNRQLAQLDLVGSVGYTGARSGSGPGNYLAPLFLSTAGPNATVGLQYQLPYQNRAARGALVQNQAALQQQALQAELASRQIASSVVTAANALHKTMLQYREAKQAAAASDTARYGEAERLRQGVGSVLDVLQTEDRLVAALLSEINAHVAYSTAIANFRFATGTFLSPRQPVQAVGREAFYSAVTR